MERSLRKGDPWNVNVLGAPRFFRVVKVIFGHVARTAPTSGVLLGFQGRRAFGLKSRGLVVPGGDVAYKSVIRPVRAFLSTLAGSYLRRLGRR